MNRRFGWVYIMIADYKFRSVKHEILSVLRLLEFDETLIHPFLDDHLVKAAFFKDRAGRIAARQFVTPRIVSGAHHKVPEPF